MGSTRNGIEFCFNSQTVLILLLLLKTVCGIELLSFNKLIACDEYFSFNLVALHVNMSHVTFRGISWCLIGSRASYGHHGWLLGFTS